jgi:hypothetical protein
VGSESESEVELNIYQIVVVLAVWEVAVIHVRVFSMNLYILGETVVETAFHLID